MEIQNGGCPEIPERYTYDVTNHMTRAWNVQNQDTTYVYDAMGRRVSEEQAGNHETAKTYLPDLA